MSTKIAIIAGDYSNGWSDSWIVQMPTEIKALKELSNDKEFTMQTMNEALVNLVNKIESNEKIFAKPKDEPCCEKFKEWFSKSDKESFFCGCCGQKITEDRRARFKNE